MVKNHPDDPIGKKKHQNRWSSLIYLLTSRRILIVMKMFVVCLAVIILFSHLLFIYQGRATLEPDEEEGEVSEPGSKDKYDIKKIWDFPGFNIPASERYEDVSSHL